MARRPKNDSSTLPESGPTSAAALPDLERQLDEAYETLGEALRAWRKTPDDKGACDRLMVAIDQRDHFLNLAVDEDIRRDEARRGAGAVDEPAGVA